VYVYKMKEKNNIVIIDYQLGNLFSVKHACLKAGLNPVITSNRNEINDANILILPGVGAFGDAMLNLQRLDLVNPIKDKIQSGTPFFGICLGLQLLFEESEEHGTNKGLGIFSGVIKKFDSTFRNNKVKVPHVGWNTIYSKNVNGWVNTPLQGVNENAFMYFVHSYYALPDNESDILSFTNYEGYEFCSSVKKNNVHAFQFHPEKSGTCGLNIYENLKLFYHDTK